MPAVASGSFCTDYVRSPITLSYFTDGSSLPATSMTESVRRQPHRVRLPCLAVGIVAIYSQFRPAEDSMTARVTSAKSVTEAGKTAELIE